MNLHGTTLIQSPFYHRCFNRDIFNQPTYLLHQAFTPISSRRLPRPETTTGSIPTNLRPPEAQRRVHDIGVAPPGGRQHGQHSQLRARPRPTPGAPVQRPEGRNPAALHLAPRQQGLRGDLPLQACGQPVAPRRALDERIAGGAAGRLPSGVQETPEAGSTGQEHHRPGPALAGPEEQTLPFQGGSVGCSGTVFELDMRKLQKKNKSCSRIRNKNLPYNRIKNLKIVLFKSRMPI